MTKILEAHRIHLISKLMLTTHPPKCGGATLYLDEGSVHVGPTFMTKFDPQEGDYYLRLDDGLEDCMTAEEMGRQKADQ